MPTPACPMGSPCHPSVVPFKSLDKNSCRVFPGSAGVSPAPEAARMAALPGYDRQTHMAHTYGQVLRPPQPGALSPWEAPSLGRSPRGRGGPGNVLLALGAPSRRFSARTQEGQGSEVRVPCRGGRGSRTMFQRLQGERGRLRSRIPPGGALAIPVGVVSVTHPPSSGLSQNLLGCSPWKPRRFNGSGGNAFHGLSQKG